MLKSDDPKLARNKKHVFDFWRIVYEGAHLDKAPEYMAETYIQHNPNVPSGRKAFVELSSKQRPARSNRISRPSGNRWTRRQQSVRYRFEHASPAGVVVDAQF
jgi:hypothetical protein